ncbi:MAG: Ig-like domain-containing protein, partial [Bacteroidota bacterium]
MKKLSIVLFALLCIFSSVPISAQVGLGKKILFIRGGSGSGGLNSGNDSHLSDINDFRTNGGNHGWGELATLLEGEGYTLEQITEGSGGNSPIDLVNLNLSQYAVIVFGSNNATYGSAAVDALMNYVNNGGAALFISDANFGSNWNDAPSSDNHFLSEIGWEMNQDQGTYNVNSFEEPNHPILQGIGTIGGEGVSPITLKDNNVSGVSSTILVKVPSNKNVRRITNNTSQGPSTSSTDNDAVLIVAQVGQGRVAGHFDRNTFFNNNGAGGRDLNKLDHIAYAQNLFNWLAASSGAPSNLPPVVNITSPSNGASFDLGTKVSLSANISDTDGSVANAQLLLDNNLVRQINQAPFQWGIGNNDAVLGNLSLGNHTLSVVATDDDGATSTKSVSIVVVDPNAVNPPPVISFVDIEEGDTFPVGTSLTVEAAVSDPNGSVAFADLFLNGNFLRKERVTPYEWGLPGDARDTELQNMAAGTYVLRVEAQDDEGAQSVLEISIRIEDQANQAPTVSITSPQDGANFVEGDNITVTVAANDSDGSISKVELFDGNQKLGEDSNAPYEFTFNNVSAGTLNLTARATDNDQAESTSAAVNLTIASPANQPPTVSITSPQDGANFVEGDNITVTVSANDSDGSISKVELFDGNQKLGEDSNAPYEFTFNNVSAGTLNLTARATDDDQAESTSAAVNLTIASPANQLPTVSITSPQDGANFVEGDNITVTVSANDSDGSI